MMPVHAASAEPAAMARNRKLRSALAGSARARRNWAKNVVATAMAGAELIASGESYRCRAGVVERAVWESLLTLWFWQLYQWVEGSSAFRR